MTTEEAERNIRNMGRHLTDASTALVTAFLHLRTVTDTLELWEELGIDAQYPDTGPALVQRSRAVKAILGALQPQLGPLAAEPVLLAAAWEAHLAALRALPRAHVVTSDKRLARTLAEQFTAAAEDTAQVAFRELLDGLGLGPQGPGGSIWVLEVVNRELRWAPRVPAPPRTAPVRPTPIAHQTDDSAEPRTAPATEKDET
jgi:hypothetical protein